MNTRLMDPGGGPSPTTDPSLAEIAGLIKEVRVEMSKDAEKYNLRMQAVEAAQRAIGDAQSAGDAYLKEVEKKIDKALKSGAADGLPTGEALKSAIPQRHRSCLEKYARTTMKREKVIKTVAMESWMKNAIWLHYGPVAAKSGALMLEEMDHIERALGFDPVPKGGPTQKAALQEDTSSEGGFTVPAPVEAEVLRVAEDNGIIRTLARLFPMTTKSHLFPDLATNVIVNLTAEEGTITPQEPTFGQKALTARKFTCRAITSMELVQDAAIGIMSLLMELLIEKYALKEDQQAFEGLGSGSEFTGLVSAASVNEVTNGTNGATFSPSKAVEQKWKGRKRSTRNGAAWVCAPEIAAQIESFRAAAATDATPGVSGGGPFMYMTPLLQGILGLAQGQTPDGIFHGFPLYTHSELNVARTVGSSTNCSNMYFGPWRSATILGDLLGLTFGVSEHTQWATGQLDLRMIKRTGWLVSVPAAMTKQTGLKIA